MPIIAWIDERHLPPLGLANHWGYNPVAMMALDPGLSPGGVAELREAVAAYNAQPLDSDVRWLDEGFGLWARHGIACDPQDSERRRRAEWTRYWDDDFEQVLAPEATACPCCQGPLVEIGTEELPPKSLKKLGEAFANDLAKGLRERGLAGDRYAAGLAECRR